MGKNDQVYEELEVILNADPDFRKICRFWTGAQISEQVRSIYGAFGEIVEGGIVRDQPASLKDLSLLPLLKLLKAISAGPQLKRSPRSSSIRI